MTIQDLDEEFYPLPYYPYEERPTVIPVDVEEAATALYLSSGVIEEAAAKLKVSPLRLTRVINRSPRLQRLHAELVALLNDRVHAEVIRAFSDEDSRRREWASAKVMASESFRVHPLAPHRDGAPSLTLAGPTRVVISWDDGSSSDASSDADAPPALSGSPGGGSFPGE